MRYELVCEFDAVPSEQARQKYLDLRGVSSALKRTKTKKTMHSQCRKIAPTGAWLKDEIFVLGVWEITPNKQNKNLAMSGIFYFSPFVYTKALLAKVITN